MDPARLEQALRIKEGLEAWAKVALPQHKEAKKKAAQAILDCFCNETIELDLSKIGVIHQPFFLSLPPEIGELTHLRKLVISNLGLATLPPEIGNLTQLIYLQANHNYLSELPKEIGQLTNLRTLLLYNNRLEFLSEEIGALTQLESINVGQNRLTYLPNALENLTQLRSLGLLINNLDRFPIELIKKLPHLTSVLFCQNPLEEIPDEIFTLPQGQQLTIALDGIYFSAEAIEHVEQQRSAEGYAGAKISYTSAEDFERNTGGELDKLLSDLAKEANKPKIVLKNLRGNPHLKVWLSRLQMVGDYNTKRQKIAALVDQAIRHAEADADYQKTFLMSIKGAADTCGNRMAVSLLYLEIHLQIAEAIEKKDLSRLAYLIGHGSWTLGELGRIAHLKIKSSNATQEIEVYLAYPIKLKKALNIPISQDTMLYEACASLSEEDLKGAEDFVKSQLSDITAYCNILAEDADWEKGLEAAQVPEFLELRDAKEKALEECSFEAYEAVNNRYESELAHLTRRILEKEGFALTL